MFLHIYSYDYSGISCVSCGLAVGRMSCSLVHLVHMYVRCSRHTTTPCSRCIGGANSMPSLGASDWDREREPTSVGAMIWRRTVRQQRGPEVCLAGPGVADGSQHQRSSCRSGLPPMVQRTPDRIQCASPQGSATPVAAGERVLGEKHPRQSPRPPAESYTSQSP